MTPSIALHRALAEPSRVQGVLAGAMMPIALASFRTYAKVNKGALSSELHEHFKGDPSRPPTPSPSNE